MTVLLFLALAGCPWRGVRPDPEGPPTGSPGVPPPAGEGVAGQVVDGVFHDASLPLAVPVPPGWTVEVGSARAALRCAFEHVQTDTRVEIWSFPGASSTPRPRAGCAWTFQAEGRFANPFPDRDVRVATCTPDQPDSPLVLGTYLSWEGMSIHAEAIVPRGRLMPGRLAAEELVSGILLDPPDY